MTSVAAGSEEFGAVRSRGFARDVPADLPTPYVEIDEARLDRNLTSMQQRADSAGVRLRPHVKTHKSLEIARRQVALGARGLTASKPSEALVFVEAGFRDVTLAYPVVVARALDPLLEAAASRDARIACIAADPVGAGAIAAASARHGVRTPCFLKVDVGLGRVGVRPADPDAVGLAALIQANPHLGFAGLLSHAGHVYAAGSLDGIADIAAEEGRLLSALRKLLQDQGIAVPTVSVGSTPTVLGAPVADGVQEIRPGNYAFLDLTALRLGVCSADDLALTVIARVIAVNDRHAIVDAGSKALSSDLGPHGIGGSGFGVALAPAGESLQRCLRVDRLSEEHGFVSHRGEPPAVGSLVRIFPNHSCAVVAQFGHYLSKSPAAGFRTLPVDARGCFA